jgi:predicted permease
MYLSNPITSVVLPPKNYATMEQRITFFQRLLDGLENAPGVETAASSVAIPLEHCCNGYITVEGREDPALKQTLVEWNYISTDYFRTFGIPFLKGRNFNDQDLKDTADAVLKLDAMAASGKMQASADIKQVAVINQTMARQFWPQQDPVGRTFKKGDMGQITVIGIIGDVNERGVRRAARPQAYLPLPGVLDEPGAFMRVAIRSAGRKTAMLPIVRDQVHSLDSSLALGQFRTMEDVISDSISLAGTSYQTLLLGSFALLALLLTAVGIYGVMAYTVTQRTHEIGIRVALGARRSDVLGLVIGQGAKLALAGVALGLAGTFAVTRLMSSLLFGISATDPLTFAAVAVVLTAVALLACYLPARRAMRVDPLVALRYE